MSLSADVADFLRDTICPEPWRILPPTKWRRKLPRVSRDDFVMALDSHEQWIASRGREGKRATFKDQALSGLEQVDTRMLPGLSFVGCRLNGTCLDRFAFEFAEFTNSDLHGAIIRPVSPGQANDCWFVGTVGMVGPGSLSIQGVNDVRTQTIRPNQYAEQLSGIGRLALGAPSWDRLRSLGELPVLGVSNVVFAGLLIYAGTAQWYNNQIDRLREFAGTVESEGASVLPGVLNNLRDAPCPWHFGLLLIGIASLSLSATIFKARSSHIIQDFRLPAWTHSGRSGFWWYIGNASEFGWRWLCSRSYLFGAVAVGSYLTWRFTWAVAFFLWSGR